MGGIPLKRFALRIEALEDWSMQTDAGVRRQFVVRKVEVIALEIERYISFQGDFGFRDRALEFPFS